MRASRLWKPVRMLAVLVGLSALLGRSFLSDDREIFLPGPTSDGHHVFTESCTSCHEPFQGAADENCMSCHETELQRDTHPVRLFEDPRWAADLEIIDATRCAACHAEHDVTPRGVTMRADVCFACHDDVVRTRASHRDLAPASCGSAGCHNYHDNSALSSASLEPALGQPDLLDRQAWKVLERTFPVGPPAEPESVPGLAMPEALVSAWKESAHARSEVGCRSCHSPSDAGERVDLDVEASCRSCHELEVETFHRGKHGVRREVGLAALRPERARLLMTPAALASELSLGCGTCHDPHRLDTRRAAVEACVQCHDDGHSRAFAGSPHALVAAESQEEFPGAAAVTCATCHLPRIEISSEGGTRVAVNHNNSLTLLPPDRMVAMVCSDCHGVELSLSAVLDETLIRSNFRGRPARRSETFRLLEASRAGSSDGGRE